MQALIVCSASLSRCPKKGNSMDLGLKGKTALVLGGGRGLGFGVAQALAAEGVNLALLSRSQTTLQGAADTLQREHGVTAVTVAADLANWEEMAAAITQAEQQLGGTFDILLNNSGGPSPSGVQGLAPALWTAQFDAMVLSLIRTADRVLPGMRARGWGRILTIASTTVVEPNPALAVSNTLRSALVGWSKTLASEVAKEGITVNMLLPGRIATDRTQQLDKLAAEKSGKSADTIMAEKAAGIPAGRYGSVAEFGAAAAFLASVQASYITGSMLRIDGGALHSV